MRRAWGVMQRAGSTVAPRPVCAAGIDRTSRSVYRRYRYHTAVEDVGAARRCLVAAGCERAFWRGTEVLGDVAPLRCRRRQRRRAARPGSGYGFWAGAPSALYDPESGRFYCYYRARWPLGDRRGGLCRIVASADPHAPPEEWEVVWEATREQFGANSIERSALIRDPFSGEWRLYVASETAQSYDRVPATWRIDLLQAQGVGALEPRDRRIVMDASMYGFTHVKDPVVLVVGGEYLAFTSVAWRDQHLGRPAQRRSLARARG